ncbi:ANTAR domain-containing protein [Rhodococcus opacus]|uniref:ANTAR domain-containing protein n=1 Tax=Rhodococcus opacus RKJ300 = JCM 13270 TaxID=1165867 RepID=I0WPJ2_RHOOP|nr:hypothetical protein W59_19363 [Rhodococcus opacus RKJ300 = JCM 13270]
MTHIHVGSGIIRRYTGASRPMHESEGQRMIEATAESPLSPLPAPTRLTPRRRLDGRELLATAKGILIAARRCSDARAFDELLDVSRRHHLTVVGAARNLVDLAAGSPSSRCAPDAVRFDEWEQLLAQLPPRPHAHAS